MEKRKFSIREIFNLQNLISALVLLAVLTVVFLLIYGLKGFKNMYAVDGTFVAGCIGVGVAGLSFANNDGTFDVFPVGFSNLVATARKNGTKKYDGLFEYRELKKSKRYERRFIPLLYLTDGLLYLIVSLILYFTIL